MAAKIGKSLETTGLQWLGGQKDRAAKFIAKMPPMRSKLAARALVLLEMPE